ncbi:MAG: family transporter protein [Actinomycetota bacterium]|jgi:ABC-type transport system involved in multi-copper enzyme maturation permease subunit|nr:family transporter protein [Actinomycetota bacterium]
MSLLRIEIERSLRRRAVWALVAIAVVGIVIIATIAFVDSTPSHLASIVQRGDAHPAILIDWWRGEDDSLLLVGAVFLFLGGVIGGAAVVGGEWRSGSMATVLTWEPRRVRLLAARLAAIAWASFVVATVLQGLLLLAVLPAVLLHGWTTGADRAFAISLLLAVLRISAMTALVTSLSACVASVSKNTAAAIIAVWAWAGVLEGILRNVKPGISPWTLTANVPKVVTWSHLGEAASGRSPAAASVLLAGYGAILAVVAVLHFRRVDAISG